MTARSAPFATETCTWPRYGRSPNLSGDEPALNVSGPGTCWRCGKSVVLILNPGPKVCGPAERCQSWPIPSRTLNGARDETVNRDCPCARNTRTFVTDACPIVVPL